MHTHYCIIDEAGTIVETGATRLDRIQNRVPDGCAAILHDGSISDELTLPITPSEVVPGCTYGFVGGKLCAAPIPETPTQGVPVAVSAKQYLNETDWYVIRFIETGVPIPEDVSQARELARVVVNSGGNHEG